MKKLNEYEVREVKGYEGIYSITSCGQIYSHYREGRWLKPAPNAKGYFQIILCKDGKKERYYIHRLVALNFVEGWFDGAVVKHLDEIKTNNNYNNLKWSTIGDSNRYSRCKTATLLNPEGEKITFTNIAEFARQNGLERGSLGNVVNGKAKSSQGWTRVDNRVKKHRLISPQGEEFTFTNIAEFARQNGLDRSNLTNVVNGKAKSSRGWKRVNI